jgi:curved DNA-binding protein CbpA
VEVGMNFYAVLGVPRDADEETIRGAYRILARRYHPDRGAGSSAEKFRMVNEAYETLIDPGSRHSHDLSLLWAERQVPVRAEPMVAQSGPFPQEDAGLFGRFRSAPPSGAFRISGDFDELFDRWFHSFDGVFFGPEWPW